MDKSRALVKNTLILGFGKLATQVSAFLLLPIYTMFLSPSEFGFVDLIIVYTTLFAPLLILQLDRAAFRELIAARGNKLRSKIVISNTLRMVIPMVLFAVLLYIAVSFLFTIPKSELVLLGVLATISSTLLLQFARGLGRNDVYAKASVVLGTANLGVAIGLVVGLKMGVVGVLISIALAHFSASLYILIAAKLTNYISFSGKIVDKSMQKELIRFAWPLVPSAVSWWFIKTFDRTLITIIVGLAANGLYAAANKYALIFSSLYSIFDMSWTESASEHINSKNRDKFFTAVYNKSFRFFTALALILITITPFVFNVFVGEKFSQARIYVPVLIMGGLLNAFVSQYSVIYIAKKMTKKVLITSISAAIISVVLNVILINAIGTMGAAVSLVITFLTMAVWRHYDIKKYINIKFEKFLFVKIFILLTIAVSLYYINTFWADILSLLIVGTMGVIFGREVILGAIKGMLRKLSTKN